MKLGFEQNLSFAGLFSVNSQCPAKIPSSKIFLKSPFPLSKADVQDRWSLNQTRHQGVMNDCMPFRLNPILNLKFKKNKPKCRVRKYLEDVVGSTIYSG